MLDYEHTNRGKGEEGNMVLLIVFAALSTLIAGTLFSLRYLAAGRFLRRLRIATVAFDVLALGWFVVSAMRFHRIGGPSAVARAIVIVFVAQLFLMAFLLIAALVRGAWRHMMAVPADAGRRRMLARCAVYPALAAGVGLYGGLVESKATVDRFFTIPVDGLAAEDAVMIAQISDVHLGNFFSPADLETLLTRIAGHDKKPDLLAVTGDLFDDEEMNPEAVRVLGAHASDFPDGIWYVLGNHEHFRGAPKILSMLKATQVHVLVNAAERVAGRALWIAGTDYPMDRPHFAQQKRAYAEKALGAVPKGVPAVLLAHHPEFIDDAAKRNIALTLTGHTHGSQFGLFGMPLFPVFKYTRGMVRIGGSYGYVHTGNGSWFPFRFGCPPEIAYFALVPKDA
ncbi:Ser/Thr phosphatase family protein [Mitsuokella sp. oral taxon 131 str. W9106]|nr:Ser/Thr phosphatase family protein [Mitsuokella sp. oral taxon 131 str. W9106]